MASNLSVMLAGAALQVINQTDSTTRVNSDLGSPSLPAAVESYWDYIPIATGAGSVITLASTTIWVLAIRNLGGVNGTPAGNITVQAQVTGGALPAAANSPIILPGGLYIYWNTAETAGGIIALTLVASLANTPVEMLMAA